MTESDKLQRLMEMTHCSQEEAAAALDACSGDLLDAVLLIERLADANNGGVAYDGPQHGAAGAGYAGNGYAGNGYTGSSHAGNNGFRPGHGAFAEAMLAIGRFILRVINAANSNMLDVSYHGNKILSFPLSVIALLLIFCFWVTVPAFLISMFIGWRYSFSGEHFGRDDINNVMNRAGEVADDLKEKFGGAVHPQDGEDA